MHGESSGAGRRSGEREQKRERHTSSGGSSGRRAALWQPPSSSSRSFSSRAAAARSPRRRRFDVTTTADATDRSPGDGTCATASRRLLACAPRSRKRTRSPAGTDLGPARRLRARDPDAERGSPEHRRLRHHGLGRDLGEGIGLTIIDGGWPAEGSPVEERGMDRLFEIHPNASFVLFSKLTIREGFTDEAGAGIENWNKGTTRLEDVMIKDSLSAKVGGGINHAEPSEYPWVVQPTTPPRAGRLEIVGSIFKGNASGGGGAAINNAGAGTVTIWNSQIIDNPGLMIPDPARPAGAGRRAGAHPRARRLRARLARDREPGRVRRRGHDQDLRLDHLRKLRAPLRGRDPERRQRQSRHRAHDDHEEPEHRRRRRHLQRRRQRDDQGQRDHRERGAGRRRRRLLQRRRARARSDCAARSRSATRSSPATSPRPRAAASSTSAPLT